MVACGCRSYEANPLSKGCSQGARSNNIGRLIREGYEPKQAVAIAYATQRKAGCKVPKKSKAKRNPPYNVYGAHEEFVESWSDLPGAIQVAQGIAGSPYDKAVVYDAGRTDRGPRGEFVAMFRPNKKRRRKAGKSKRRTYEPNPGIGDLIVLGFAGLGAWWAYSQWKKKQPITPAPVAPTPAATTTATGA